MKIRKNILGKAGVLLLAAVFIFSSTAVMADTMEPTTFSAENAEAVMGNMGTLPRDEEEISYYDPDTLTSAVGIQGGTAPYYWQSAIRLTQDELATYDGWDLIAVTVAHSAEEYAEHWGEIIIYGEGTATAPGAQITNESYYFDTSQFYRVDLTTPVPLSDHNEIWVACSWESWEPDHCAYIDQGPAVIGKGDWIYLNSVWQEIHDSIDSNWGMGAIVEGEGKAELSITNIGGPIGVSADVKNIGGVAASDVEYSISVTGGLLSLIDKSVSGTAAELAPNGVATVKSGLIFGLGKITIEITANAANTAEVTETVTGTVLGPLVIGIK